MGMAMPSAFALATKAGAVAARAKALGIAMPITETVSAFLAGEIDLAQARRHLLERPITVE